MQNKPEAAAVAREAAGGSAQRTRDAKSGRDATALDDERKDEIKADICVIGGGSAGLSVAAAVAAFGQSCVLIEKHKMGGDCLNYGCVPSKALLASARRAQDMRTARKLGIGQVHPLVDHGAIHDHVKGVIAAIAPNDSVERFTGLGVRVIQAAARFTDARTVMAGGHRIRARRFVVATGSSPAVPDIVGLDSVPYFTNETIFDNTDRLDKLIVIGGGPIGMELAQAYHRLGSRVTVIEAAKALGRDDPELSSVVLGALRAEGIDIREGASVERVEGTLGQVRLYVVADGRTDVVEGSHILVAAGRKPNTSDLGLEAAGIAYDKRGVKVSKGLKTTNRSVFAIGDVAAGQPQFTHVANYHAGIVVRRALFRIPANVNPRVIPWVTFTDPELAHVGMTEEEALRTHKRIGALRWPYHENDRAQAERRTVGHVKAVIDESNRILGATIAGEHAGELIQMWALAVSQGMKIKAMTDFISPYPTYSEINKRAAYRRYATAASSPWVRKAVGFLAKFG